MKRFFWVFILTLMIFMPVFAEEQVKETYKLNGQVEYDDNPVETIYLDETIEKPQVNIPQKTITLPVGILNITSNSNTARSALARAMVNRNSLGDILPLSDSVVAQTGGWSYGSTWSEAISHSQLESTAGMFVRYDSARRFAVTTSFNRSANRDLDSQQYSLIKFTPEWKITDKLTLKDSFTNYTNGTKNKNEIIIVYTPALKKYADSLKFQLGIAQSFYSNGNQSSGINFSTGFKL